MKSSELTRYDPASGRVVNKLTVPGEEVQQYLDLDPYLVEGEADFLTDYVLNKVITRRPASTVFAEVTTVAANGTDTITVSGIPTGAEITLVGTGFRQSAIGDGTLLKLSFAIAGQYELEVKNFPDLSFKATIHAT